ncbi:MULTISPECIES: hypothetical protein [Priestia]|uniref:hypothetical protein n=1 Tax=Priestia TaxID=2800373 RepID=UPI00265802CC|nr:hypothetical protein [Priestia aryabhattai]WKG29850.1 hypothetical protein QYS54_22210 [Priestia aryabhattai]
MVGVLLLWLLKYVDNIIKDRKGIDHIMEPFVIEVISLTDEEELKVSSISSHPLAPVGGGTHCFKKIEKYRIKEISLYV